MTTDLARVATMQADDLRHVAESAVPHGPASHWSLLAVALGRIEAGGYFRQYGAFASTRAYAVEELDLPPDEARVLLERLYPAMVTAEAAGVPLARWAEIPKSRAVALVKVLAAGGDPRRWVEAAAAIASTTAFLNAIKEALNEEVFHEFTVRHPASLTPLIERAMHLGWAEAGEGKPGDPMDPDKAPVALEEIFREYVNTRSAYA